MSKGARSRTVRPHLDREVIVDAAISLAAAGEPVTFRSLGTALGADPTAVYRHFRDKLELLQAVTDRLIVTTHAGVDHEAPWRDQLRDGAVRTIDTFAAHPHIGIEVSAISTGGEGELAAIDWVLVQLGRAGLGTAQAVRFYAAYTSYTLAAAAALSRQRLRDDPSDAASRWVGDIRAADAARLPALSSVLPELLALTDREVYLTGIEVLLDSVATVAPGGAGGAAG